MVYLHDLVEAINGALKVRLSSFPLAEYYGIATQAVKNEGDVNIVYPSVISLDGHAETISYNNKPPFILYHRAYSTSFNLSTSTKRYGDGASEIVNQECNTIMKIICTGNRKALQISPEEFALVIADALPTNATIDGAVKFVHFNLNSIQYDSRIVFNGEFEKLAYFIGADKFLFSIQYTIAGGYMKGCLKTCNC